MKYIIISLCCLTSCATPHCHEPAIIKIPVSTPCHSQAITEPAWNISKLQPDAPLTEKLKAALSDLYLSKAYNIQLKAQLDGC